MDEYVQIITTTNNKENAEQIAKTVVEKRLAGCVQVLGPVTSTYWWKGKIEDTREYMCIIKTRKELYKKLEKAILELHPYETPEILAVPVIEGLTSYLTWLDENVIRSDL